MSSTSPIIQELTKPHRIRDYFLGVAIRFNKSKPDNRFNTFMVSGAKVPIYVTEHSIQQGPARDCKIKSEGFRYKYVWVRA